jgi:23S rRNA (adenine1618-N6)-methyltransferase
LKNSSTKQSTNKGLHPRNIHGEGYSFELLQKIDPELKLHVFTNEYGTETIDFAKALAVLALNKALLLQYYNIQHWAIPPGYLCPPIPGRADYVHYVADLLAESNEGSVPKGSKIKCLDLGVGANCIYPIIGNHAYGWQFVGADIDPVSVKSAASIAAFNASLKKAVSIRQQTNKQLFFEGIIQKGEYFHAVLCNPPFYASAEEAMAKNSQKNKGLGQKLEIQRNFGGVPNELWYEGGELRFISSMIKESVRFASQCMWFTSLVSNKDTIYTLEKLLKNLNAKDMRVVPMTQGQKQSRFIAWRF